MASITKLSVRGVRAFSPEDKEQVCVDRAHRKVSPAMQSYGGMVGQQPRDSYDLVF